MEKCGCCLEKMFSFHYFSKKHVDFDIVDPEKLGFDLFFFILNHQKW